VMAVMHERSLWMIGEEEGLSRDLTDRSSRRWSDGCGREVRIGGGGDLSSGESVFLRKRNSKGRQGMDVADKYIHEFVCVWATIFFDWYKSFGTWCFVGMRSVINFMISL
jgi:hypothetical protein